MCVIRVQCDETLRGCSSAATEHKHKKSRSFIIKTVVGFSKVHLSPTSLKKSLFKNLFIALSVFFLQTFQEETRIQQNQQKIVTFIGPVSETGSVKLG